MSTGSRFIPPDPREEGHHASNARSSASFNTAGVATGWAIGAVIAVEIGLLAVNKYNPLQVPAAVTAVIITGLLVYVVLEIQRLKRCRDALIAILDSERTYLDLLNAAWAERDAALRTAEQARLEVDGMRQGLLQIAPFLESLQSSQGHASGGE